MVTVISIAGLIATACASTSGGLESGDVARSGVGVVAEGCGLTADFGSGVAVDVGDRSSLVITVAHTIKGASTLTVIDADGREHEARVVAFDKDSDLAALDVADLGVPPIQVADSAGSAVDGANGSILTWSRDDGVEQIPIVVTKRLRVTIEDIYIDDVIERGALEIAGPVTNGDSGGPVLDASGHVIGIIYANSRGREQVGFATDQRELADLLASVTGATVDNGTCF